MERVWGLRPAGAPGGAVVAPIAARCGRVGRVAAERWRRLRWALSAPVALDASGAEESASVEEAGPALDPGQVERWLWGEGRVGPGSDEETLHLVRPLSLRPVSRLLLLGARLGQDAVAIARAQGCYVTACDVDANMVSAARALVRTLPRITLTHLDPAAPRLEGARLDHAFGRFALHAVPDRGDFLAWIRASLRPGGHVVLVEYVAGAGAELAGWGRRQGGVLGGAQGGAHALWPVERWRHACATLGFDLRIEEDRSAQHKAAILRAWSQLLGGRALAGLPRRRLVPVLDSAERWMREAALIEAGALRVTRFYLIAPG